MLPGLDPVLPSGAVVALDPRCVELRSRIVTGPWTHEPDRVEWRAHGFPCLIVRQPSSGHLCGYVGVEPGHPWHGVGFDSYDTAVEYPSVHGGITYSAECHGNVCHVARPGEPEHVFWQGFDARHAWDLSPRDLTDGWSSHDQTYRTVEYMVEQCEQLAAQAALLRTRRADDDVYRGESLFRHEATVGAGECAEGRV